MCGLPGRHLSTVPRRRRLTGAGTGCTPQGAALPTRGRIGRRCVYAWLMGSQVTKADRIRRGRLAALLNRRSQPQGALLAHTQRNAVLDALGLWRPYLYQQATQSGCRVRELYARWERLLTDSAPGRHEPPCRPAQPARASPASARAVCPVQRAPVAVVGDDMVLGELLCSACGRRAVSVKHIRHAPGPAATARPSPRQTSGSRTGAAGTGQE